MTTVPVHVASGLTPAQLKAYRIADNQTATLADWDYELLVQELIGLQQLDFDLDLVGFSADELHELFNAEPEPGLTDPDFIPEPPEQAVTQRGDHWLLGDHRLLCGDSSQSEAILDGREDQPAAHGALDGEAGRAGHASHSILLAAGGARPRSIRRQRLDPDRRGANG
jgi:site-specific DNA-methyltransferase (adenine-specific)